MTMDGVIHTPVSNFDALTGRAVAWDVLGQVTPGQDSWENHLSALTMVLTDALIAGDTDAIEAAGDPLRDRLAELDEDDSATQAMRGWLAAMAAFRHWALMRLPSQDELTLKQNTHAWKFVSALRSGDTVTSGDLVDHLDTGDSQVSRLGRSLIASGLVAQRRVGRKALWELTPRGRKLVHQIDPSGTEEPARQAAAGSRSALPRKSRRTAKRLQPASSQARAVAGRSMLSSSAAAAPPGDQTRIVAPRSDGWVVLKEGRVVAKADTKKQAMDRAKAILANSGGGQLVPHDRQGRAQDPVEVPRT